MDRIRIRGGRPLTGAITISGAKNAALPLMAACLLTDETLKLENLPNVADIATLASLLRRYARQPVSETNGLPSRADSTLNRRINEGP